MKKQSIILKKPNKGGIVVKKTVYSLVTVGVLALGLLFAGGGSVTAASENVDNPVRIPIQPPV